MRELVKRLKMASQVGVSLYPAGGYKGVIDIAVSSANEEEFDAAIELSDWTRFPARIRAAATELRDQGFKGRFRVSHDNGILQIVRI